MYQLLGDTCSGDYGIKLVSNICLQFAIEVCYNFTNLRENFTWILFTKYCYRNLPSKRLLWKQVSIFEIVILAFTGGRLLRRLRKFCWFYRVNLFCCVTGCSWKTSLTRIIESTKKRWSWSCEAFWTAMLADDSKNIM